MINITNKILSQNNKTKEKFIVAYNLEKFELFNQKIHQLENIKNLSEYQSLDPKTMLNILKRWDAGQSFNQIAADFDLHVSSITRSLKKVAILQPAKKTHNGWKIYKIKWIDWVVHYLNYNVNKQAVARAKQIEKYQAQFDFIEINCQQWADFKKLSGSRIISYLKQAFAKPICQSTIYNWISKGWLAIKNLMIFKKGYKKPKKQGKKRHKTVFNPNYYQNYDVYWKQRIAKLTNVYQIDTMMGKQDDQIWVVVLVNLKTKMTYIKHCQKSSQALKQAVISLIKQYHLNIEHLLMDNGWENILLHEVDPNIKLYHTDPGKPNQKALVERMIRDLRTYVALDGKTSFNRLNEITIKKINNDFNAIDKFFPDLNIKISPIVFAQYYQ